MALQSLTNSAFSCNGLDVVIFRTIFKIYFLENAAMIQNNLYQHFPKCFTNSFPTGTSCNTMRDPSWNEEIGTITQNPHGTADIILDNSCFDTVSV